MRAGLACILAAPHDLADPQHRSSQRRMTSPTREKTSDALLLLAFFLSGAAALGYELLWTRLLTLALGSETVGVLATLAGFFGGMALGAAALHRRAETSHNPVRLFVTLELVAAGFAVASPFLLHALSRSLPPLLGPITAGDQGASLVVAVLVATLVLLPGTVCLGATLAALVVARRRPRRRRRPPRPRPPLRGQHRRRHRGRAARRLPGPARPRLRPRRPRPRRPRPGRRRPRPPLGRRPRPVPRGQPSLSPRTCPNSQPILSPRTCPNSQPILSPRTCPNSQPILSPRTCPQSHPSSTPAGTPTPTSCASPGCCSRSPSAAASRRSASRSSASRCSRRTSRTRSTPSPTSWPCS